VDVARASAVEGELNNFISRRYEKRIEEALALFDKGRGEGVR
jgi:hypothetical protein